MRPSRVTATNTASSLSASGIAVGLSTLASSTFTLFASIGVITMKMISRHSITSTIGVTLILELTFLPSSLLLIAITAPHTLVSGPRVKNWQRADHVGVL